MNGFILLMPLLVTRYFLLGSLSKKALSRAAHVAPTEGNEKTAFILYQLFTIMIFGVSIFLRVMNDAFFGIGVYTIGIGLYVMSVIDFSKPSKAGLNTQGVYRYSRNPMYVAQFVYLIGCVLLTQSVLLLIAVVLFQIVGHWIVLSEERWCIQQFGTHYLEYMKRTKRYI